MPPRVNASHWPWRNSTAAATAWQPTHSWAASWPSVDDAEIAANRNGASNDPKADAAVRFAAAVVRQRGRVSNDQIHAVLSAGYSDAQVLDILLAVALNTFTNYVNEVAQTEVDFPSVQPLRLAA